MREEGASMDGGWQQVVVVAQTQERTLGERGDVVL